ncbi:hypothetical protein D3C76_1444060 [compost metagenome]
MMAQETIGPARQPENIARWLLPDKFRNILLSIFIRSKGRTGALDAPTPLWSGLALIPVRSR